MTSPIPHTASQQAAREIYQRVLDMMTDALMSNDEPTLISGVVYPFRVSTMEQDFIIESPMDWLECTSRFRKNLLTQGVNHYIRLATDAEFLSENYIRGSHVTHTMRNANVVVAPYENRATLTRVDGVWRFSELDSAIQNNRWPISMARVPKTGERLWAKDLSESDIRRSSASPKAIYQNFLDELGVINFAGDFEAWCEKCEFPHYVHIEQVDEVIETPDHIRPFLEMVTQQIEKLGTDKINRKATHAEFISATQLCGYHSTTFETNGEVRLGPVAGRYILNRSGTSWRMVSVTNSLSNTEFPYSQPKPGDALVSLREIQERTLRK
ncbi:MAG: hypothetical protein AAF340_15025 [Pseudomonadota bacterium]